MGELIGLLFLAASFCGMGVYGVVKLWPQDKPKEEARGTWYRAQETVGSREGPVVRVILVREYEGRETGRLVVAEVNSSDGNWNTRVQEAIAEADNRLATLESGERR